MSKDCCSPKHNKYKTTKKRIDPFLMGIIAVTVLLMGGAVYFGSKMGATAQVTSEPAAQVSVENTRYDWGEIDINGGIISKAFVIKNTSAVPLKLYDIKTSCMCTTAQLKTTTQSSKKFGMHETSTSVFEVAPSDAAELIVEFDPAFHGPSGVGAISRLVTMNTNSTNTPNLAFNLTANVVRK